MVVGTADAFLLSQLRDRAWIAARSDEEDDELALAYRCAFGALLTLKARLCEDAWVPDADAPGLLRAVERMAALAPLTQRAIREGLYAAGEALLAAAADCVAEATGGVSEESNRWCFGQSCLCRDAWEMPREGFDPERRAGLAEAQVEMILALFVAVRRFGLCKAGATSLLPEDLVAREAAGILQDREFDAEPRRSP